MAAEPSDEMLMDIFRVYATDVDENRKGWLSLQQRLRLLSLVDPLIPGMIVVAVFAIVMQLGEPTEQTGVGVLIFIVLVVVTVALNRGSLRLLLDAVGGQTAEASGEIRIQQVAINRRTMAGIYAIKHATAQIGSQSVIVPASLADSFQDYSLHIYYAPRSRQAVSARLPS